MLSAAGIGEPKRTQLALLPHITEAYLAAHLRKAKAEHTDTALLIHRLQHNDPAPDTSNVVEACRKCWIMVPFAAICAVCSRCGNCCECERERDAHEAMDAAERTGQCEHEEPEPRHEAREGSSGAGNADAGGRAHEEAGPNDETREGSGMAGSARGREDAELSHERDEGRDAADRTGQREHREEGPEHETRERNNVDERPGQGEPVEAEPSHEAHESREPDCEEGAARKRVGARARGSCRRLGDILAGYGHGLPTIRPPPPPAKRAGQRRARPHQKAGRPDGFLPAPSRGTPPTPRDGQT